MLGVNLTISGRIFLRLGSFSSPYGEEGKLKTVRRHRTEDVGEGLEKRNAWDERWNGTENEPMSLRNP